MRDIATSMQLQLQCNHKYVPYRCVLQRRGERRATINEVMVGVYDVNVL